jgi:hypothetical protein
MSESLTNFKLTHHQVSEHTDECDCGWEPRNSNESLLGHLIDGAFQAGRVDALLPILQTLHNLIAEDPTNEESSVEPPRPVVEEPVGIGAVVTYNLDGYQTHLVNVGDGIWTNPQGMNFRWMELDNEHVTVVFSGVSL